MKSRSKKQPIKNRAISDSVDLQGRSIHLLAILAPRLLGAFFGGLLVVVSAGCDPKGKTPDWEVLEEDYSAEESEFASAPKAEIVPEPDFDTTHADDSSPITTNVGIRFIAYNVENWLVMDRQKDRQNLKSAPKPESEKQAVARILGRHSPDMIGISEIGQPSDLAEIQSDLRAAGLNLPHSHYTGGADPTRHLGFLSRFPIVSTTKPATLDYRMNGKTYSINRGILDVTVQAKGKTYRFVGAHLKSKRESKSGDQEGMRLNEARLLRRHVDSILKKNSEARVILYGDLNDTRSTPTIRTITGNYSDPTYLTAIPAKDSQGHAWTHHWESHDTYSRIDFVMVTRALRREVNFKASKIIDDKDWAEASDHRPILAIFR